MSHPRGTLLCIFALNQFACFPTFFWILKKIQTIDAGKLIRKISGIDGEVTLSEALSVRPEKKDLEDVPEEEPSIASSEDLDNDGEEVKKIAGKGLTTNSNEDLILHLVSTSLSNIHEK